MPIDLAIAKAEDSELLGNLMQFYIYDFSEFVVTDMNGAGLFEPYPQLDLYCREGTNHFAYLLKENGQYMGFALVRLIDTGAFPHFSIAEFFIMKRFRRQGKGKAVAKEIFNLHRGDWEIYQRQNNLPAYLFWKEVIGEYSNGHFSERTEEGRTIQNFSSVHSD